MALTWEQELWGAASMVLERYGAGANNHIAERVRDLALAGDEQGVAAWQMIADRVDQLRGDGASRQ